LPTLSRTGRAAIEAPSVFRRLLRYEQSKA